MESPLEQYLFNDTVYIYRIRTPSDIYGGVFPPLPPSTSLSSGKKYSFHAFHDTFTEQAVIPSHLQHNKSFLNTFVISQ